MNARPMLSRSATRRSGPGSPESAGSSSVSGAGWTQTSSGNVAPKAAPGVAGGPSR